jgi:excisionase family DNA binding protein
MLENVQNVHLVTFVEFPPFWVVWFGFEMKELVSPKQVAKAIGVGESTVKRWCDRGLIPMAKTAGGHRRLRTADVLAYVAEHGYSLSSPQLLGLPVGLGQTTWTIARARERFLQALIENDDLVARQLLMDLVLAKHSVTAICEDVIAESFHAIGDLWDCGDLYVYQERRSCEVCLRLLHEMATAIPTPPAMAPLAIGATIAGDIYTLPVTMAGLVLKSLGWNAELLGTNLPFDTLVQAVRDVRPRMFWLSASHIENESAFVEGLNLLFEVLNQVGASLVIGGRGITNELREQLMMHCFTEDFRALEMFARSLHPIRSEPTPPKDRANVKDEVLKS